ncbi:MAG: hypothetical protein H0W61_13120 [Bacteroidetes bacterium]|nr:hypothetical protein [Bacteroidota bacterium]
MKKIYLFFLSICFLHTYSQAPKLINYQGIVRNAAGIPVTSPVKLKFEIFPVNAGGTSVYTEVQSTTTNSLGLFSTQIGKNSALNINWSTGSWFLQVSVDTTNSGSSFSTIGRQQMVSVPYALYAENAGTAPSPSVTFSNNVLYVGTNSVSIPSSPAYIPGNGISINSATITNAAPDQTVTLQGGGNTFVNSSYPNFTVTTPPQILSINNNIISLSNGGGNIVLPATSSTPNTSLTGSGAATVTSSGTNSFNVTVPPTSISGTGGISVSGSYPNFIIGSLAPASPTITGTGVANTSSSGNNYTVNVPPPTLNYGGNVLSITQGSATSLVTIPAGVTPTITGAGIATVSPASGNNFTVSVAPLNLTGAGSTTVSGTYPNITVNTPFPPSLPPAWLLLGNGGTVDGTHFIGTTDNVPLNFRVNNQKSGRIDPFLSNTFFGYWAGRDNTIGTQNSAFGVNALLNNTSGTGNTAFGTSALGTNTTGSSNTAIGAGAGASSTGSGNVFIGYQAGSGATANGQLHIANNNSGLPLIFGDFGTARIGLGTTTPAARLDVFGTSQFIDNNTSTGYSTLIQNNVASGISGGALDITNSGQRSIGNSAVNIQNLVTKSGGSGTTKTGLSIQSTGAWAPGTNQPNVGLFVNVSGADINNSAIFLGGNVGIGTNAPVASSSLHVNGGVTITDGTQGLGKVLTSDASGNAQWKPLTILTVAGFNNKNLANVGNAPTPLTGPIGSFNKTAADTKVEIIVQTHINVSDMILNSSVVFEVRVNGTSPASGSGRTNYFIDNNNAGTAANYTPVTIIGQFPSLAAGLYNIEIWVYAINGGGSATGISVDPGNYSASSVTIKEYR